MNDKDNLKISIIVPVYNREKLLEETIVSVIKQDLDDWELILVDDGSSDASLEIAKSFSVRDHRIRSIERKREPKGGSVCRNIGLENAKGDYVIFLDSDDLLAPFCLSQRCKYFRKFPENDFLVFPMLLFKDRVDDMMILQNIPTKQDNLDRFLNRENVWLMSSPMWKTESIRKLHGFNEHYLSYQDWELNVRALVQGLKFQFIQEAIPDNYYRQHSETISMNRYSDSHNESNLELIFHIVDDLATAKIFTDLRRKSLVAFMITVLNRYRNSAEPIHKIMEIYKTHLDSAKNKKMIDSKESAVILSYLKWHHHKLAYKFGWFRKFIDNKYLNGKLKHFFTPYVSNQLKHIYSGTLDYDSASGK